MMLIRHSVTLNLLQKFFIAILGPLGILSFFYLCYGFFSLKHNFLRDFRPKKFPGDFTTQTINIKGYSGWKYINDVSDTTTSIITSNILNKSFVFVQNGLSKPSIPAKIRISPIVILHWTGNNSLEQESSKSSCPYHCKGTANRNRLIESSAVLFYLWDNDMYRFSANDLPPVRFLWQKWILMMREAPARIRNGGQQLQRMMDSLQNLKSSFNLTSTYMRDSSVWLPYGFSRKRPIQVLDAENRNFAAGKTDMVAWLVSHCHTNSGRERLVKELQKYVDVHVYGKCGSYSCPKEGDCLKFLGSRYKFYLSLENSDCDDYITEKLWNNAYHYGMVPIVHGLRNNYRHLAPPGSYIQWEDFDETYTNDKSGDNHQYSEAAKRLAKYLKKLDLNNSLYNEYFSWKRQYEIYRGTWGTWWCDLCTHLHKNRDNLEFYEDIQQFVDENERCNT